MKMECRHHKRWKQRETDSIHCEGQAKDEAHFSVSTQWRLHCRSLKSPSNASLGLWGGEVGKGEQGMGLCYLCFSTLCFFSLPPPKYIFSVCIKCQVNFLGAVRDVSSPSVCVAGRWIVAGWCACRCVSVCLCLRVCVSVSVWVNGERERGHGKAKREARGGEGGSVQYL